MSYTGRPSITPQEILGHYVRRLEARTDELESRQAQLVESEERTRLILAAISDGIVGLDMEGRITLANPAFAQMLGFEVDELLGKPMHPLVHHTYPDGRPLPHRECSMHMTSRDGQRRTVSDEVLWRKDGAPVPVEYVTTPVVRDGCFVGVVVDIHDISRRRQIESDMRAANEEQAAIFESATLGIGFIRNRVILKCNHKMDEMFGFERGGLVGENTRVLYASDEDYLSVGQGYEDLK